MNSEILSIETLEEIVRLKRENKELKNTLDMVIQDASEYVKRIDKAIEYIEENIKGNYFKRYDDEIYKECEDLLDILKGE